MTASKSAGWTGTGAAAPLLSGKDPAGSVAICDGNRDGNDGSPQRPGPALDSQLLSGIRSELDTATPENGRSLEELANASAYNHLGRAWMPMESAATSRCPNQVSMAVVDSRGRP